MSDDLNADVTLAIFRAEHGGTRELWLSVAECELALVRAHGPATLEGEVARCGHVTALAQAGSFAEAAERCAVYAHDVHVFGGMRARVDEFATLLAVVSFLRLFELLRGR